MKMDGSGAGWAVRAIVRIYDRLTSNFTISPVCRGCAEARHERRRRA